MAYIFLLGLLYVCMDICIDNLFFTTKYYSKKTATLRQKQNIMQKSGFWAIVGSLIFFFQRLNTILELSLHTYIYYYIYVFMYVCMYLYIGRVCM